MGSPRHSVRLAREARRQEGRGSAHLRSRGATGASEEPFAAAEPGECKRGRENVKWCRKGIATYYTRIHIKVNGYKTLVNSD